MKKFIIGVLLFCSLGQAAQPVAHTLFALIMISLSRQCVEYMHWDFLKPVVAPVVGMGSHVILDRAINEGNQGQWQYDIGLFMLLAGFLAQPTTERKDKYFEAALWGAVLPDTILKKQLHPAEWENLPKIFDFTNDNTALAEVLCLNGLIAFNWEIKF